MCWLIKEPGELLRHASVHAVVHVSTGQCWGTVVQGTRVMGYRGRCGTRWYSVVHLRVLPRVRNSALWWSKEILFLKIDEISWKSWKIDEIHGKSQPGNPTLLRLVLSVLSIPAFPCFSVNTRISVFLCQNCVKTRSNQQGLRIVWLLTNLVKTPPKTTRLLVKKTLILVKH